MHLLHIREGDAADGSSPLSFFLEYHIGVITPNTILSHRWGALADEVTFQDMAGGGGGGGGFAGKSKKGYQKLEQFCLTALEYGLDYAWIDTCCIDKSSSAELSEAINSMYVWYEEARVCFAYLEDVPRDDDPRARDSRFRRSAWFTRGWTLQELVAPSHVFFFAGDWSPRPLGDRSSLADIITDVTKIPKDVLVDRSRLSTFSIAQKMSWASRRQTTRVEDEAYSLMGLRCVSMPTIFGEGRRAVIRLQDEIMRNGHDHSIFAWDIPPGSRRDCFGMLAESPRFFEHSAEYVPMDVNKFLRLFHRPKDESGPVSDETFQLAYSTTNFGLQIQLPTAPISKHFAGYFFAFLACTHGPEQHPTVIFLRKNTDRPDGHFYRTRFNGRAIFHDLCYYLIIPGAHKLWIAGPALQKGQLASLPPGRAFVSRVRVPKPRLNAGALVTPFPAAAKDATRRYFRGVGGRSPPGGIFSTEPVGEGDNGLDIMLSQGDSAIVVMEVSLVFYTALATFERGGIAIVAIGMLNGRVWYKAHEWQHYYRSQPERAWGTSRQHAEQIASEYDAVRCGEWLHPAMEDRAFTDEMEPIAAAAAIGGITATTPQQAMIPLSEGVSIRVGRWRVTDQSGEAVEELKLSFSSAPDQLSP